MNPLPKFRSDVLIGHALGYVIAGRDAACETFATKSETLVQ